MTTVRSDFDDGVKVVTLDRPQVHNSLDGATVRALKAAIETFAGDDDSRVLVITGAGENSFCSGADLTGFEGLQGDEADTLGPCLFSRLDPGKPTIAAVNGYCFAAGLELALWCDFRVAAGSAAFGVLNRRFGVPLCDGGTQLLARSAGLGNALWMIETGVRIDARRAQSMGIVQEIVGRGRALQRALELAHHMANYPNQMGLRADRNAAIGGWGLPLTDALELEARVVWPTLADPEMVEGLRRFASRDRPSPPVPAD